MYITLQVKYSLFLSYFGRNWIFSIYFRKILKHQISWKFVQWEPSCSMRNDEETIITKLLVAFCNYANAPNKLGRPRIGLGTIMVDRKSPPSTGNQTPIFPPVTFNLLLWISVSNKMCIVPAGTPINKTQTTSRVSEVSSEDCTKWLSIWFCFSQMLQGT
jgi:hypothetical protein